MAHFRFFTISFQLNFKEFLSQTPQASISKIAYSLCHQDQKIFIIHPKSRNNMKNDTKFDIEFDSGDSSTLPTFVQFLTLQTDQKYDHEFQISFEFTTLKNDKYSTILCYDNQIIPNMSVQLPFAGSHISLILNTIPSLDISQNSVYQGFIEKVLDDTGSFEICFRDESKFEYPLYKSKQPIQKNTKCGPFCFRYLNLSNRAIYVKYKIGNSTKESQSIPIHDEISHLLTLNNYIHNSDIFPLIKVSPLSLKQAVKIKQISLHFETFFFGNNPEYLEYSKIGRKFIHKIGFPKNASNANSTDFINKLNEVLARSLTIQKTKSQPNEQLKSPIPRQQPKEYCVFFVYDSTSSQNSDNSILQQNIIDCLNCHASTFSQDFDQPDSSIDISTVFSLSGQELIEKKINYGFYNLTDETQTDQTEVEMYSRLPIIYVTLFHDKNTFEELKADPRFKLWNNICNRYHLIKLICVKQETKPYLQYISELKVIHDLLLKWLSQIPFAYHEQYLLDPSNCVIPGKVIDYNEYIHRRLLELLTFDSDAWERSNQRSYTDLYHWTNTDQVLSLLTFPLKQDIVMPYLDRIEISKRESVRATIYAAALAFLYYNADGDPDKKFFFMLALDWLKSENIEINDRMTNAKFIKNIVNELRTMQNNPKKKRKRKA